MALEPHRDEQWTALVLAAGLDELAGDPRLTTRSLWRNPGFGYATLSRALATKTTAEWLAFCAEQGIPAARAPRPPPAIPAPPAREPPAAGPYNATPPPAQL